MTLFTLIHSFAVNMVHITWHQTGGRAHWESTEPYMSVTRLYNRLLWLRAYELNHRSLVARSIMINPSICMIVMLEFQNKLLLFSTILLLWYFRMCWNLCSVDIFVSRKCVHILCPPICLMDSRNGKVNYGHYMEVSTWWRCPFGKVPLYLK